MVTWSGQNRPKCPSTRKTKILSFPIFTFSGCCCVDFVAMDQSKRVSLWSVEDVLEWVQDQYPAHMNTFHKAIIKHAISGTRSHPKWFHYNLNGWTYTYVLCLAGRALLRLKDYHLELLGVEDEEQQKEILQDILLLRVQEEINELNDIYSGENAEWVHGVFELRTLKKPSIFILFWSHIPHSVQREQTWEYKETSVVQWVTSCWLTLCSICSFVSPECFSQ